MHFCFGVDRPCALAFVVVGWYKNTKRISVLGRWTSNSVFRGLLCRLSAANVVFCMSFCFVFARFDDGLRIWTPMGGEVFCVGDAPEYSLVETHLYSQRYQSVKIINLCQKRVESFDDLSASVSADGSNVFGENLSRKSSQVRLLGLRARKEIRTSRRKVKYHQHQQTSIRSIHYLGPVLAASDAQLAIAAGRVRH